MQCSNKLFAKAWLSTQLLLLLRLQSTFATALDPSVFPKDFIFGTATAAYQVEGAYDEDGRGMSVWDTFSQTPGKVYNNENGNIADDQYHRIEDDIKILQALGVQAYRLSISWTRVLPTGRAPANAAGLAYYHRVFDLLQEAGIAPYVTLFHWDTPQALDDEYGSWLSDEIVPDFEAYVDVCFQEFGDRVKRWFTLNEPWTVAINSYGVGSFAPGRCSDRAKCDEGDSTTEPYLVAHNMLLAHAAAVHLYRQSYQAEQGGQIGIVLNIDHIVPMNPASELDQRAADQRQQFQFAWYADPLHFGAYPAVMRELLGDRLPTFTAEQSKRLAGSFDFIGMNHYTSYYATYKPLSITGKGFNWFDWWDSEAQVFADRDGQLIGPASASPWLFVYPEGISASLLWAAARYPGTDWYITENGVPTPGEADMTAEEAKGDAFRQAYLEGYIAQVGLALAAGVPVKGYFIWSLMDNFEWADGYSKRFGIVYIDYENDLERTPKDSFQFYADLISSHQNPSNPVLTWLWTFLTNNQVLCEVALAVALGVLAALAARRVGRARQRKHYEKMRGGAAQLLPTPKQRGEGQATMAQEENSKPHTIRPPVRKYLPQFKKTTPSPLPSEAPDN